MTTRPLLGLALLLLAVLVGGLRADTVEIEVLDAGGNPLPQAAVWIQHCNEWGCSDTEHIAGEDGTVTHALPDGMKVGYVRVQADGLVPMLMDAKAARRFVDEGKSLRFKLAPAASVGGIVTDEAGNPIEGAAVEIHWGQWQGDSDLRPLAYNQKAVTDVAGKWVIDGVPESLDAIAAIFKHPDYIPGQTDRDSAPDATAALYARSHELTLRAGKPQDVRVVTGDGEPIKGATIFLHQPAGEADVFTTDADGQVTLPVIDHDWCRLVVRAEGFAQEPVSLSAESLGQTRSITLEPEVMLRGQIVDADTGEPITNGRAGVDWNGLPSTVFALHTSTDDQGQFELSTSAKPTKIHVRGFGYASREMTVDDPTEPFTVELVATKVLRGTIVDATTGEAVEGLSMLEGHCYEEGTRERVIWQRRYPRAIGTEFEFTLSRDTPIRLRFEAAGYRPVETDAYSPDDPPAEALALRMEPVAAPSLTVLTPTGEPAVGAQVVVAEADEQVIIRNGEFTTQTFVPKELTNSKGTLTPRTTLGPTAVFVLHSTGYAFIEHSSSIPTDIRLSPWNRIEGVAKLEGKVLVNTSISGDARFDERAGFLNRPTVDLSATTDEDGRYEMNYVPATQATIAVFEVVTYDNGQRSHLPSHAKVFDTSAGRELPRAKGVTETVNFGEGGVTLTAPITLPKVVLDNPEQFLVRFYLLRDRTGEPRDSTPSDYFSRSVNAHDLPVTIHHVPEGRWTLRVDVEDRRDPMMRSFAVGSLDGIDVAAGDVVLDDIAVGMIADPDL